MIRYRHATINDIEPLLNLIEKGFANEPGSAPDPKKGEEHRVLFSYLYSRKEWDPEWVYLAEDVGRLIAAVGFFPQHLFFEGIEIPIWAVSPVVTDPGYRGKGYAGTCLTQGLAEIKGMGVPGVFLWGLPDYYPRFGFVPVLPRYKTKVISDRIKAKKEDNGRFRSVRFEDLSQIASIYNKGNIKYWLQPKRDLKWWEDRYGEIGIEKGIEKEVPFPKKENFLVWENNKGDLKGYLNYLEEPGRKIVINESGVVDPEVATEMVATINRELFPEKNFYIRGTPSHDLNVAAYRMGGIHIDPAPRMGMIKIIDWQLFFSFLFPIFSKRVCSLMDFKDGERLALEMLDGQLTLVWHNQVGWEISSKFGAPKNREQEELLTKLIFGYYDPFDLNRIKCNQLTVIERLFPRKYPFIWDNNYLY